MGAGLKGPTRNARSQSKTSCHRTSWDDACLWSSLHVIGAEDLPTILDELNTPITTETTVRGYTVKVTRQAVSPEDVISRRAAMAGVIARSIEKRSSGG